MSAPIGTSTFTEDWLLATLKQADSRFSSVFEVKSVKEVRGGKGFASKVYLCNVGYEDVVLKVPEMGKLNKVASHDVKSEETHLIVSMHNREYNFYEEFGCLTYGIAEVLVLCTDSDVRRQITDELLREYYETLKNELNGNIVFTLEQEAQNAKFFMRAKFSIEDAIALVEDFPERMSANEFVGTSRYSHEWVALSLSESCETFENLRKNAAIQTIDVKEISGKNGFCSKIYHCHIRFVDGNKFDAILKVPETGDMSDVLHDTDGKKTIDEECMALMHKRECRFLTEFAPRVNFPIPKIYQCVNWTSLANPGAILMESFYGKVATVDLVDGFTKPQLVAIAKDLARFQAYFLKLEDKSWVEKCKRTMHPQVQGIYANLIEKLKKDEPETFGADVDAVLPYVKNPDFIQHTFYSAYEAHGLPAVFAHGDLWVNNVLWKTNADGTNANEVATYVDWQLSHAGCLTTDLASALVICTDAHLRRLYTDDILGVYYETLKEEVGDVPFSLNDVKKLFEANFAAQCFTLMICIGHLPAMNGHLPENVQRAQYEKFKVRVKLAVEDLLDIGFPKEFNNH
ncbi:hypothetical protein QR680_013839 [Steinernema hermaphroditum]|uniref:CHK kinase-like domain-containing protein n=1 Tax=Steinernema hermaphroditum TaxID=289476 RepID=A0AA39I9L9_9BILA|nr:hypothetical protein QR680_013839 [Steinernema hermaphroditum]